MAYKFLNIVLVLALLAGCATNPTAYQQEAIEGYGKEQVTLVDGPYIFETNKGYKILQVIKDHNGDIELVNQKIKDDEISDHVFSSYDHDGSTLFQFKVRKQLIKEQDEYPMPQRLTAISDIEGRYSAFANLLLATGVVNEKMEWAYGDGHLVLVGDFFDRGSKVTETLWLIYKLEQEALDHGGKLHFIIGNHEHMNLLGYTEYVSPKYLAVSEIMGVEHVFLYGKKTVLGQWLRSKNVAVKIGDFLFTHGGISPEFLVADYDLSKVNNTARQYMEVPYEHIHQKHKAEPVFNTEYGPLWYRGYMKNELKVLEVEKILDKFAVRKIVVGHTPVESISMLYGQRVIAIDVPHHRGEHHQKALVINGTDLYEVNGKGKKQVLSTDFGYNE